MLSTFSIAVADEDADDMPPSGYETWEDYYDSLLGGSDEDVEVPPFEQMKKVSENDNFIFYYHIKGVDSYILDKRNNKLWSSAIHPDYMDVEKLSANNKTTLLDIVLSDENDAISSYSILNASDENFIITEEIKKEKLILNIEIAETGVSFEFHMWIDKQGFNCSIPIEKVKEKEKTKLISISVLPHFGTASSEEQGYILYSDGSGALVNIKAYKLPSSENYTIPFFGSQEQDMKQIIEHYETDMKNLTLPVVGIKHTNGAMLAAITSGAGEASLQIHTGDVYSSSFKFDYRRFVSVEYNYTGNVFDTDSINELVPNMLDKDCTIKYFLLADENAGYSEMAVNYREYLKENKLLKNNKAKKDIPVSLNFFMGITESGFFKRSFVSMINFEQITSVLDELNNQGLKSIDSNFTGWGKGGFDAVPTSDKVEKRLGGIGVIKKLSEFCNKKDMSMFFDMDFIYANENAGKFNKKKDVTRDWLGKLIGDDDGLYILNPEKTYVSKTESAISTLGKYGGINFSKIGELAIPDYSSSAPSNKSQIIDVYKKALQISSDAKVPIAGEGGNAYVLPYVNRLYNIPDTDSGYHQNDCAVPFYQMVVHGSIPYTSLAGNMSHDIEYQKLKWIETGSIPHFLITEKNPVNLKETNYNRIFSSEYKVWKDTIVSIYKEFNESLSHTWDSTIDMHEKIKQDVVCITYAKGTKVYINYGKDDVMVENLKIPTLGYVVD